MITGRDNEGIAAEALCLDLELHCEGPTIYVNLPSVILHLKRRLEIKSTMRKSAGALKEQSNLNSNLTLLDTAERYEHQAGIDFISGRIADGE